MEMRKVTLREMRNFHTEIVFGRHAILKCVRWT